MDSNGKVANTGSYSGSVDFGSGAPPCNNTGNLVVANYDLNGSNLWAACVNGGTGSVVGNAVTMDTSGNVFVTGEFSGTISLGGVSLSSAGATDIFTAKYSSSGAVLWAVRAGDYVGDKGVSIAYMPASTSDPNAHVVVTGLLQNPDAIFVTKYSAANGSVKWTRRFLGTGTNTGRGVAIDSQNNVVLAGDFYGTLQLEGSTETITNAGEASKDILYSQVRCFRKQALGEINRWNRRGKRQGHFRRQIDRGNHYHR